MQNFDYNYFSRMLRKNGYLPIRCNGSHQTWKNEKKNDTLTITCVREVNARVGRMIIKEHNLKVQYTF